MQFMLADMSTATLLKRLIRDMLFHAIIY